MAYRFRKLVFDDSLVKASHVVNVWALQAKIQERIQLNPELNYNYDNASFLKNIVREINLVMGEEDAYLASILFKGCYFDGLLFCALFWDDT